MPEARSESNDGAVKVNRAPVMTLWAAVVAERRGHDRDAALSLGRAVAGLNAQSKGRSLGIYTEAESKGEGDAAGERKPPRRDENLWIEVCGRPVPAKKTSAGIRAVTGDQPIDPRQVQRYLIRAFGDALPAVRGAMEALAGSYTPDSLEEHAYDLYEQFRPAVASGQRGWGQKGTLDLGTIRELAKHT